MIKALIDRFWHAPRRRLDLAILWPSCIKHAPDLNRAKAAFAVHAFNDPAWLALGDKELFLFIDNLKGGEPDDQQKAPGT
jgi:hypothetical protein